MPKPKIRPVSPDEVKILREHDTAVFTYADSAMGGGMHLKIGPEVAHLTDQELLLLHNDVVHSMQTKRDQYEHVAVEIASVYSDVAPKITCAKTDPQCRSKIPILTY